MQSLIPTAAPDFIFPVYDDQALVLRLISDLRKLYPDSSLVCISDGKIASSDFINGCAFYSVKLIETSQRLKLPECGGLWLERLLSNAIEHTSSPYIIRTEGDTKFWRRFESFPEADFSGTLNQRYGFSFTRGGCIAIKRAALIKILASGLLRDAEYRNNSRYSYQRYGKFRYPGESVNLAPVLLSDLVLGSVASRLGLSISSWDEVDIQFRETPGTGFAATHPHRLIN